MPRKSAASLTILHPRVDGREIRLSPPANLGATEKQLFISLVGSCPASHFRPSDQPLLCQYVQAACLAEHALAQMTETGGQVTHGAINPWFKAYERTVRMMAVLAMRLRLTPSSRMRPETAHRMAGYRAPSYYETQVGDEDA